MTKATEDVLAALHKLVAESLTDVISSGEANSAVYAAAIKFLKDNNITCNIEDAEDMSELEQLIRDKQKKAKRMQVGNVVHIDE